MNMLNLHAQCDDIRGGALERIFGCREDAAGLMDGICALLKETRESFLPLPPSHSRGQLSMNQTPEAAGNAGTLDFQLQNYKK